MPFPQLNVPGNIHLPCPQRQVISSAQRVMNVKVLQPALMFQNKGLVRLPRAEVMANVVGQPK